MTATLAAASILAACSAPPPADRVFSPAAKATAAPAAAGTKTVAYFEGSFDAQTRSLTFAFRSPSAAELTPEATLTYGEAPGDVYVHTCGTNGDGYTNSFNPQFAPPTFPTSFGPDTLGFELAGENGTGSDLTGMSLSFDSVVPSSVKIGTNPQCGGTCQFTGTTIAIPCTMGLGNGTVAKNPSFPALGAACDGPIGSVSTEGFFDDSASGGGPFTFTGHVTAN